jgi:hypothetical protein
MRYFAASIFGCIFALAQAPGVKPSDKCSVQGTVISSTTGEPVKKASVVLEPMGPGTNPYATTADAAGHFLIDEVDAGRFRFVASRSGYIEPSSSHGKDKYITEFTLEKSQKMKEIVLKLAPQGVITGRILDEDGDALGNVTVSCLSIAYKRGKRRLGINASSNTNELGEFRLAGLSAGKYVIGATVESHDWRQPVQERPIRSGRTAGEEAYVVTYYPRTVNPNSASPIVLSAGAQVSGINITLMRNRTVTVKGHVSTGTVSRQAYVILIPRAEERSPYVEIDRQIDPKGNFEMDGIAPGSYILFAEGVGGKSYRARMPLEVRDVNIGGIELELQPPAEIQGHLIVEDNGDLKSKPLQLMLLSRADNDVGRRLRLQDESTFVIEEIGFEGPYDVLPGGLPENMYVKSIRLGEQDVLQTGFDFTPGVTEVLTLVLNPNGGQIEGSVTTAKDEPAAGAKVTLIPDADHRSYSRYYKTADADQNGRFSVKGVAPGEYKIYAWEDIEEGAYEDPDFMKPHESDGHALSIKERAHETVQIKVIPAETANPKLEK